jgi:aryl-alcohol dehydrogenase-like predicted oxidoreductase
MEEASGYIDLASNQVPYSMVLRDIEKEIVPYCLEHHKSILAYSPMQRGVLTGKFKPDHAFKGDDHRPETRFYSPENINRINAFLDKIKPIAAGHKASLSQLVLRWTIDQPGITVALAGARNPEQAVQNAEAAGIKLTKEELKQIGEELGKLELAETI